LDATQPSAKSIKDAKNSMIIAIRKSRCVRKYAANMPKTMPRVVMAFGIFACFFFSRQNLRMAIILLFAAGLMDFVDGFVASKLKQQTEFGQYVDTLVDFFTCGIVPVWMVFDLLVGEAFFDNILIIVALIFYCMCALWRLAYYNIIEADKFFTGLPVPGSMMMVTMAVWCVVTFEVVPIYLAVAMFFIIGTLMISGITLKKYGMWQKAMSFLAIPFLILVLIY
jgi:CDP-diacylglycerol--serine O-phosphatidyltransferase